MDTLSLRDKLIAGDPNLGAPNKSIDDLEKRIEDLEENKIFDALTGLRQRASFEQAIKDKPRGTFSVLFVDMDNLKQANDKAKSHSLGDRALKTIANELSLEIRDRNGDGTDEAFRWGGDEFVVILDKVVDPKILESIARRINNKIGDHTFNFPSENTNDIRSIFKLSVSVGGSVSLTSDETPEELVKRADTALYEAKKVKNSSVVFENMKPNV